MHEIWARVHEARAPVGDEQADGAVIGAMAQAAAVALEHARAAKAGVQSAEHREEARQERDAEETAREIAHEHDAHRARVRQEEAISAPSNYPRSRLSG
jgi:hypothetical protein